MVTNARMHNRGSLSGIQFMLLVECPGSCAAVCSKCDHYPKVWFSIESLKGSVMEGSIVIKKQ